MSDEIRKNEEQEQEQDEDLEVIHDACNLEDEDLEDVAGGGCSGGSGCCSGLER